MQTVQANKHNTNTCTMKNLQFKDIIIWFVGLKKQQHLTCFNYVWYDC